ISGKKGQLYLLYQQSIYIIQRNRKYGIMKTMRLINILIWFCILVNYAMPQSGLFINEFMASNLNWIADNDEDYEDWIEIYNPNDSSLNLAGFYITDNI
ncbi:MAG: hypothetical protein P8Y99_06730, partial [Calditrichaceae bacterium]